jgi:hypothetical protein
MAVVLPVPVPQPSVAQYDVISTVFSWETTPPGVTINYQKQDGAGNVLARGSVSMSHADYAATAGVGNERLRSRTALAGPKGINIVGAVVT